MTTYFADRGYLTINGVEVANIKSIRFTKDEAVTVVSTMARNKRDAGYKQGNLKVTGSFELEIEDQRPSIDLAFQYGNVVNAIVQVGTAGDRYLLSSLVQNNQDISTSVGESTKSINFTALDAVNENGPGVNSILGF